MSNWNPFHRHPEPAGGEATSDNLKQTSKQANIFFRRFAAILPLKKFRHFAAILPRKKISPLRGDFYLQKNVRRFAAINKISKIIYNIDKKITGGYCAPQARKFLDSKHAFERFSLNFGLKITLDQPICWPAAGQIFSLPAFGRIFYPAASGRVKILPAGRPLGKMFYPIG